MTTSGSRSRGSRAKQASNGGVFLPGGFVEASSLLLHAKAQTVKHLCKSPIIHAQKVDTTPFSKKASDNVVDGGNLLRDAARPQHAAHTVPAEPPSFLRVGKQARRVSMHASSLVDGDALVGLGCMKDRSSVSSALEVLGSCPMSPMSAARWELAMALRSERMPLPWIVFPPSIRGTRTR